MMKISLSEAAHTDEDCSHCHQIHNAETETLLKKGTKVESLKTECRSCHEGGMSNAPDIHREFSTAVSRHPVESDQDCLVCHDNDRRHNDGRLDRWPDIQLKDPDPSDSHVYTGAKINDFCLSCHDNSPIPLGNPPQKAIDLSSAYEYSGHGRIDIREPCTSCHEAHVSHSKPFLLKDFINNSLITGNDNSVCFACHSQRSHDYLGKESYLASEHGMQNVVCQDCHNPHGDNKDLCYLCHNNKYSAHYSQQREKVCIDCHNPHRRGDKKMTKAEGASLCFQCHQGLKTQFGSVKDGTRGSLSRHPVDDDSLGRKLKCTDCHNPHLVTRFDVVSDPEHPSETLPFPRAAYSNETDAYDGFCLACHNGSRDGAKNIQAELQNEAAIESGFISYRNNDRDEGLMNFHGLHKNAGQGCQNCHASHASKGTQGSRRGALLHEWIYVGLWERKTKYYAGRNSCQGTTNGLSCHGR